MTASTPAPSDLSIGSAGVYIDTVLWVYAIMFTVLWWICVELARTQRDILPVGFFLGGSLLGPVFLFTIWNQRCVTEKDRYATIFGFGVMLFFLGSFLFSLGGWSFPAPYYFYLVFVPLTGVAMLLVFLRRRTNLPSFERPVAGFWEQVAVLTWRSLVQQLRAWPTLLFDLGLPIMSGVFLGVIFFDQYYQQPLLQQFFPGQECPTFLPVPVCRFLELPANDPIPAQATLSILSVALSAMTSSLRVFGNEHTVFLREQSSSVSTEAYYLAKCLGHLPVIVLAPTCFLLYFYAFTLPVAGFGVYMLLYMLVYLGSSGLAYLVSIVVPRDSNQLVGILSILVFMMFSGANPTLQQLADNELLPVLKFPPYVSLFRWANELFYIKTVAPYNPNEYSLTDIYGYSLGDEVHCWMMLGWFAIIFRIVAYVALVYTETR